MQIETKIMEQVKAVLHQFGTKYMTESGVLKRNTVINDLDKYDRDLITALLSNQLIYDEYTEKIADADVFKLNQFINMFEYKEFWEDSFTKYANRIGLTGDDKFISDSSDVVLDFPYKDAVLKAGMNKEDVDSELGGDEPFLNETLAHSEISELFEPKILVNAKRYDKNGEHDATYFNDQDNLIIKGNNLIALYSLKRLYGRRIKLIYLDPPYNTGNDSFNYNDRFNHAAWLTFMKNRLEIAKALLSVDGMIFIHTDDNEQAYLKVLMDEIFGRDAYLNTVTVKTKASSGASGGGEDKRLKKNVEYLTIYRNELAEIKIQEKSVPLEEYISTRKDEGKTFAYNQVLTNPGKLYKIGETVDGRGNKIQLYDVRDFEIKSVNEVSRTEHITKSDVYTKYLNKIFTTENAQTSIRDRVRNSINDSGYTIARYVPISGKNKGDLTDVGFIGPTKRLVSFLSATSYVKGGIAYKTEKAGTLWDDLSWSSIKSEGGVEFANGEKPEKLLHRVIASGTKENDLVLDFFMGSATTQAVALKMHRRFIGIDQMNYINTISVPRLQKVIAGEQGGISKDVDWHGGGSFVYAELMEKNQGYLKDLLAAKDINKLGTVYKRMKVGADFDFRVDLDKYENDAERKASPFEEQKKLLIKMLDKNQLYYNEANIDDVDVRDLISDNDYRFNKSFYGKESE
ncbi:site-specific DNA-methyltransferase [Lactobacillus sp. LSI2-1]|nr:site-specific DNA-methyltransferase [Lactobacillus sp. LSI2-1]